jgi:3-oxoacyl-[acyl-carrier protein] reductase
VKKNKKLNCLIIGGSQGIGKNIAEKLNVNNIVQSLSSKELDTSNINQVLQFCKDTTMIDVLVLNTGGPPPMNFFDIKISDWERYFNQLMLSMILILQRVNIADKGYVFLISSHTIKNPQNNLTLSNSFRVAISSIFKSYSKLMAPRGISCINIAPGPIKTKRLESLVDDMIEFENSLPMKMAGAPDDIGNFVTSIVDKKIKYLSGVIINFDGGLNNSLL